VSERSLARLARAKTAAIDARVRLTDTLDQIQDALSPANLLNQASKELRERGMQAADQAMASLRSRPVLATLAVSGIGLLLKRKPGLALLLKLFLRGSATSRPAKHSIGSRPQRSMRRRKNARPVGASEETA